jgi:AAA15 family ATPase/GTPase
LNADDLKLGNFNEVKNHYNKDTDEITFGLEIEVQNDDTNKNIYRFLLDYNEKGLTNFYLAKDGETYIELAGESMVDFIEKNMFNYVENNLTLQDLFSCFSNLEILESVRAEQSNIIRYKDNPNLGELLKAYQKLPVIDYKNLKLDKDADNEMKKLFINTWLSRFGIIDFKSELQVQSVAGVGYEVSVKKNGKTLHLTEMGYGFTQLIPIILATCMAENKIIIIEEPEANLHPALQSQLADLFSEAATVKYITNQFIIETHSEYLIRKLQYLTLKSQLHPEDTVIYYFSPPNEISDNSSQIRKIEIQADGSLTDEFGTGFFDEADNIAISIWNMNQSQKN